MSCWYTRFYSSYTPPFSTSRLHIMLRLFNNTLAIMNQAQRRVVIDCDPGFDDYWAILILLFAQRLGLVKIEAITCTAGNADLEHACINTVRLLEFTGATDIPVYKGSPPERTTTHEGYFFKDGFGDLEDTYQPSAEEMSNVIRKKPAEEAISDIVAQNPKQISLICLGPLTYVARVMKANSDFKHQLKDIWIMGGNDPENKKFPLKSEFNFRSDPESADVVLKNLAGPAYLFPYQSSMDIKIPLEWRYAVLNFKSPTIMFTTRAEKKINILRNETYFNLLDAYVPFAYLDPAKNIEESEQVHLEVQLDSAHRGMLKFSKVGEPKITVIKKINKEEYKRMLVKVAVSF